MSTMNKLHALSGLLVFLVIVLFVKPSILGNLYASLLGRIILIFVVLFFAMNNVTLGLLSALVIIIASNMVFHEGLDTMASSTDMSTTTIADTLANAKEKIQAKINENNSVPVEESDGVDLETIKASIQPKPSSSLPMSAPSSSEHVSPASTEPFTSMYAPI